MAALESQVLNPIVLLRLAGPNYSRSDVVRDYFDRHLFHGATIGDVYHRPGAPLIILNATDMATGEVFSFRSDRFDDLCSDLSRFPLATAVAASAAVPIAVTPISLKNFSGNGCPVNPYLRTSGSTLPLPHVILTCPPISKAGNRAHAGLPLSLRRSGSSQSLGALSAPARWRAR